MRRRGLALIAVLWVVTLLSVALYAVLFTARSEYSLARTYSDEESLKRIALSGIDYAIAQLMSDPTPVDTLTESWFDSESTFKEVSFGDGTFSIIRPDLWDSSGKIKYGIQDETGKLNLNTAVPQVLGNLPPFDSRIAAAIIDWRDKDSIPSPNGCEDEYYLTLNPPYRAKNGPFETVEELLYVRDIKPSVLYGKDTNLDGIVNSNEQSNSVASSDLGAFHYVTCWSWDWNIRNDGRKRVNVKTAPREELRRELGDVYSSGDIDRIMNFRGSFTSIGNLLDVPGIQGAKQKLRAVADRITTVDDEKLQGLLNINTAPVPVLKASGVLSDDMIQKMIEYRKRQDADLSSIGWLLDILPDAQLGVFKAMAPYITVRSQHYRIDVVAHFPDRPLFKRYMAVVEIDDKAKTARIVYFKDISHLVVKAW